MNTAVKASVVSSKGKGSQLAHTFRDHDLKPKQFSNHSEKGAGAIVLVPYREPKLTFDSGRAKLTGQLSIYKQRYEKALKEGKEKIALNNAKKIEEITQKLSQTVRLRRPREAVAIDMSWAITLYPPAEALKKDPLIFQKMQKLATQILVSEFPDLKVENIAVAGHKDQKATHIHTFFDIPQDTTWTKMLAGRSYSRLQQLWNEAVKREFPDLPIENIKPINETGIEYVDLLHFKRNTEENTALKQEIAELKEEIEDLRAENSSIRHENALLRAEIAKNEKTPTELEKLPVRAIGKVDLRDALKKLEDQAKKDTSPKIG